MSKKKAGKAKATADKRPRYEFFTYLKEKSQTRELLVFGLIYGGIFALIKFAYPYPDTFPDTGNYILCAGTMEVGGYRPIGYSWFLNWFHTVSSSVHFVFIAQFIINMLASMYLVFTIKFFIPPVKSWLFRIFSLLVILCPSALYLTNVIMSDSIFISLSFIWAASGIWLINRKSIPILILHLVILYLLIQVRYSGLFFPVFSALVVFLRWGRIGKFLWLAPLIVFGYIISDTKKDTKESVGVEAFSAFSGWQLANNAIHVIPYIDLEVKDIRNRNNRFIHSFVIQQDSSAYPKKNLSTQFMWDNDLALKKVFREIQRTRQMGYVKAWVFSGSIFQKYGSYLIMKYPLKFFRRFVIYNLKLVFYPEVELFDHYNELKPDNTLKEWFVLGDDELFKPRWNFFADYLKPVLPASNLIFWIGIIGLLVYGHIKRKEIKWTVITREIFLFLLLFILVYIAFHLITSPIALRYMTPVFYIKVALAYMIINGIFARKYQATVQETE